MLTVVARKHSVRNETRLAHSPDTRRSLLLRLRDQADSQAWREFVSIYAPLIHAYARRRGWQDADAADVAQQVLESVARAIGTFNYDQAKGTFRGWLFTITRNCLAQAARQKDPAATGSGDTVRQQMLDQQPDPFDDERFWEAEHQQQLFRWAANKAEVEFRATTWQAFRLTAVDGIPAESVARELGISLGAVYTAKSRVTARIRQLIQSVEDEQP